MARGSSGSAEKSPAPLGFDAEGLGGWRGGEGGSTGGDASVSAVQLAEVSAELHL